MTNAATAVVFCPSSAAVFRVRIYKYRFVFKQFATVVRVHAEGLNFQGTSVFCQNTLPTPRVTTRRSTLCYLFINARERADVITRPSAARSCVSVFFFSSVRTTRFSDDSRSVETP